MKPVRGRETLLLENGDAEGNVGITSNHHLSGFGQRKSADGFSANAGLFILINRINCLWMGFSDTGLHHALSSFFDSLHYSTYCLGRLATIGDIVRQLLGLIRAGWVALTLCRA